MKNNLRLQIVICLLIVASIIVRCINLDEGTHEPAETRSATNVSDSVATLNGLTTISLISCYFEYGITTSYGQQINANKGSYAAGVQYLSANLIGLTPKTTYHYRLVTSIYGNDISFTTSDSLTRGIIFNPNLSYGSVKDYEGNNYKTVQIGTQTWMAENLKATKYNDGTTIPLVTNQDISWLSVSTPGYCWYNDDKSFYRSIYGALYNWYSVGTGKLCPIGWHVPSDTEWTTLTTYLGGEIKARNKLMETGLAHWEEPNYEATNESGFTGLPGGTICSLISMYNLGYGGLWWSSTQKDSIPAAYDREIHSLEEGVLRANPNFAFGNSVRCIKDN